MKEKLLRDQMSWLDKGKISHLQFMKAVSLKLLPIKLYLFSFINIHMKIHRLTILNAQMRCFKLSKHTLRLRCWGQMTSNNKNKLWGDWSDNLLMLCLLGYANWLWNILVINVRLYSPALVRGTLFQVRLCSTWFRVTGRYLSIKGCDFKKQNYLRRILWKSVSLLYIQCI